MRPTFFLFISGCFLFDFILQTTKKMDFAETAKGWKGSKKEQGERQEKTQKLSFQRHHIFKGTFQGHPWAGFAFGLRQLLENQRDFIYTTDLISSGISMCTGGCGFCCVGSVCTACMNIIGTVWVWLLRHIVEQEGQRGETCCRKTILASMRESESLV